VGFRNHVGDLIEGTADEVHELELGNGPHAGERRAKSRANDRGFGDRGIDNALGPEAINEAIGDFKSAAVNPDIFAQTENCRIAFHLLPDALTDGFKISELWHG
jgi:hypothetical protein